MIYTVTLNPSLDYVINLDELAEGKTNRSKSESFYVGGKGINVSKILFQLGVDSTALGFAGGFTGEKIISELKKEGIRSEFIILQNGTSRINVKIKAQKETEINAGGPFVSGEEMEKLIEKTSKLCDGDTIIISGSIPKSLPVDMYERILAPLAEKNIRIVVDAEKELLLQTLKYKPFLIKPNRQELSELFLPEHDDRLDINQSALKLQEYGARNVLVSLGEDGAVLYSEDGNVYKSGVLKEEVKSTVGAGDSMIAGFIAGYDETNSHEQALRLGTACGNATSFSDGLASKEKIYDILEKLPKI